MKFRMAGTLASLVALGCLAAVPAAAQAEPHWYIGGNLVTAPKNVRTLAGLTIGPIPGTTIVITCKVKDVETIENPSSGGPGVDSMRGFKFISCGPNPCPINSAGVQGELKVTALKLPWASKLVEVPPIADEISGIEIKIACKGTGVLALLSGTLYPRVNPGFLEFSPPGTGTLGGVPVAGSDTFIPSTVEAKNP